MNFHDKKEIPPKYIYLFMTVICFILLFFSVVFKNRFAPLQTVTSAIITPMQSGINEVGSSLYNRMVQHKDKNALLKENQELTAKVDEYSAEIKKYEQENYELKRLQELLDLKEQYVTYNTIGARVIATDSTNWFYTFVIDKGTEDGVQVGCNILADGGLAGIVTEVGKNYAKVRSIIDDNSSVSATISGTESLCTVSGDLSAIKDGYINVGYINKEVTIEDGAELVTSHVSNKFLPGLLIGYISDVQMDANNLTQSARCLPVVDFKNLQEVLVILDLKANYKTDSENKNIYDSIQNTTSGTDASTEEVSSEQTTSESGSTESNTDEGSTTQTDSSEASSEATTETSTESTTEPDTNNEE